MKEEDPGQLTARTINELDNTIIQWRLDLRFYKAGQIFRQHVIDH